ncbi:hypothetical protein [Inquilinus sp. CA228]|uniref:hypothetical protein n=1 Tax=Inquilinus sp. CA228 TaxID=3455609 RepID=UPI003F8D0A9A
MLKPIERNPRPANPVRPNPEPDFQAAVQRALAARAAAEGRPPESHGYETAGQVRPGDALERLVGPDGVSNNGQFADPNLIHPDEIYFQQGKSPVSAQTEGVIDTALAYDRKNGASAPDSQLNWDAVQSAIAGELRQTVQLDANGQLQLTADQQAKLQALNSWAVGTDRLSLETQQALTQVDGEVQQTSRDTMLDQSIAAVQGDLDKVNHKLDDQSFVRKGWGWVTPGKSSGEEFQDFLEDKLDDLKQLKANDTGLPQPQYEQKVNAVLGNFDQEFQHHAKEMEDSDKTWNTIGEVGRVVAATTVGIIATAATGGNVVAGFAAGFGTYELIDAAGDISAVAQGKDMYADGHSSIIGFGMDAVGWDGAKGDGAGVSWDHTKATLKDTAIDAVSSISTAWATTAGMKVSAAVGTRLGATALPNLGARVIATSAGGTAGQVVNGTGQLATDATRLAFDNQLFTAEGGQHMLNSAKTQGIYLATAPVTGAVSGAIPIQRVVSPAATGTTQATQQTATQATQQGASQTVQQTAQQGTTQAASQTVQQGTTQATQQGASQTVQQTAGQATAATAGAGDVTRLSRLGVTAQFGNDVVSNLGGAELVAQLTQGRHMNRDEAISSVMGAVPGTAQNLAMHPQMMQRIADRRDMLDANDGMRQKEDTPGLWGWQEKIPEFRLGAQVRILGNTDLVTGLVDGAPRLGQPTLASAGGAISTKMNVRALGQSVIDSLVMRSATPLRLTLGKELTVSQRPREYRNITGKEAGMSPVSNQTVLQVKGSTVVDKGHDLVLGTDPAEVKADFMPTLQKVRDVGAPRDENGEVQPGRVMELSWSGMLPDAQQVTLHMGEMDLFGTVAGHDAPVDAFVRLPQDMSFTKLMEEQKVGVRPRAWTDFIPVLNEIWRVGGERRPEDNITVTIPKGTKVSEQAWDNMRGTYERMSMRTRIVVDDATRQLLLDSKPDLVAIHDLIGTGKIDPDGAVSYVPGRKSGMRLSAVTGKYAEQRADLLTGTKYTWHPEAANADFIFNDRYPTERIPGLPDSLPNPDQAVSNAAYQARKAANGSMPDAVTGILPKSLGGDEGKTPLVLAVPSKVNMYRRLAGPEGAFVAEATRLTGSFKLPTALGFLRTFVPSDLLRFIPFDLSLEFRGQVKIDPPGKSKDTPRGVSRAVQDSEMTLRTYSDAGGPRQLAVPSWLDTFLKWSEQGQGVLFPEGGVHAIKQYVDDLDGQATTPQQRQDIDAFRQEFLTPKEPDSKKTRLDNETLTTPETAQAIRDFLASQAKPVGTSTPANPMPLWNQRRQAGGAP